LWLPGTQRKPPEPTGQSVSAQDTAVGPERSDPYPNESTTKSGIKDAHNQHRSELVKVPLGPTIKRALDDAEVG